MSSDTTGASSKAGLNDKKDLSEGEIKLQDLKKESESDPLETEENEEERKILQSEIEKYFKKFKTEDDNKFRQNIEKEFKTIKSGQKPIRDEQKTTKDELKTIKDELKTIKDELKTIKDDQRKLGSYLISLFGEEGSYNVSLKAQGEALDLWFKQTGDSFEVVSNEQNALLEQQKQLKLFMKYGHEVSDEPFQKNKPLVNTFRILCTLVGLFILVGIIINMVFSPQNLPIQQAKTVADSSLVFSSKHLGQLPFILRYSIIFPRDSNFTIDEVIESSGTNLFDNPYIKFEGQPLTSSNGDSSTKKENVGQKGTLITCSGGELKPYSKKKLSAAEVERKFENDYDPSFLKDLKTACMILAVDGDKFVTDTSHTKERGPSMWNQLGTTVPGMFYLFQVCKGASQAYRYTLGFLAQSS